MSADYGTEHFKGYAHKGYIHVTWKDQGESALGSFSLEDIAELVQLAGQAWPTRVGVEVRYVIEMRRTAGVLQRPWTQVWSALADDEQDIGVSEDYAWKTLKGFADGAPAAEWRLSRRTIVTADEIITPQEGE